MAAVETAHVEREVYLFAHPQFLELAVVVGGKTVLVDLVFGIVLAQEIAVQSVALLARPPLGLQHFVEGQPAGDVISVGLFFEVLPEVFGVEVAGQQRDRIVDVSNRIVEMHALVERKPVLP